MSLVCENSQSVMLRFRGSSESKWSQYYSENTPLNVTMIPVPKSGDDGFPNSLPPTLPQNSTGKNRVFVCYKNLRVLFRGKGLSYGNGGAIEQYPWPSATNIGPHFDSISEAFYSDGFFVDIPDYENVPPTNTLTTVTDTFGPNPGSPSILYTVNWLVNTYSLEVVGNGRDPNYNDDPSSPTNPPGGNGSLEYELKSIDSIGQVFTVRKPSPILYTPFCECEEDCLLVEDSDLSYESTCVCSDIEEDMAEIKAQIKAELLAELPPLLTDDIEAVVDSRLNSQTFKEQIISDVKSNILNDSDYLRQLMNQLFSQIETSNELKARFQALVALGTGLQPSPGFDAAVDVAGVKVDIKIDPLTTYPLYVEWDDATELPASLVPPVLNEKYNSAFYLANFSLEDGNRRRAYVFVDA